MILKRVPIFKWNIICEYKKGFAKNISFTSQNHRMVRIWRCLWRSSRPTPFAEAGSPGAVLNPPHCPLISLTLLALTLWGGYGRQCQKLFRCQGRWQLLLSPSIYLPLSHQDIICSKLKKEGSSKTLPTSSFIH